MGTQFKQSILSCIAFAHREGTGLALLPMLYMTLTGILIAYLCQPRKSPKHQFSYIAHGVLVACSALAWLLTILSGLDIISHSSAKLEIVTVFAHSVFWVVYFFVSLRNTVKKQSYLTTDFRFTGIMICIINYFQVFCLERRYVASLSRVLDTLFIISSSTIAIQSAFYWPRAASKLYIDKDGKTNESLDNPFYYADLLSKIYYSWYTPILKKGFKRQLTEADVFKLEDGMYVQDLRKKFEKNWNFERERTDGKPSIVRVLWLCFHKNILLAVLLKAVYDTLSFAPPMLLNELLKWIQEQYDQPHESNLYGYVLASLMVISILFLPILENSYFFVVYRTGLKSRSCLVDAVYRKALIISPEARDRIGSGTIMNHLTKDAEMLERLYNSINYLWSAPIRIAAALYLLHRLVGYAAFIGFLTILFVFPLQGITSKFVSVYRKAALKLNDERINAMSELITSIRLIKFYAWENSSLARIFSIRARELRKLLRLAYCSSVNIVLFNLNPVLIAVVVFSVYASYGKLTANVAFTALSLLDIVRFPMMMLPSCINIIIEARIALNRLSNYLSAEEFQDRPSAPADPGSITLNNVSVQGQENKEPRIRHASVSIAPGSLVSVVGHTGCGKSTLLDIIAGITSHNGNAHVEGSVSYATQQAWIMNETIQENILFGDSFDESKLNKTIDVCQLYDDLIALPGGLQQEIGERGLNLSGGQKQRVALARAVYTDSDIVLLDDPLASLDAKVGRKVFFECIVGTLKERTRVFVTSQLHFLEFSDWIIFMDQGEIACQGTYGDLIKTSTTFATFAEKNSSEEPTNQEAEVDEEKKQGVNENTFLNERKKVPQVTEENRKVGTSFTWTSLNEYAQAAGGYWVLCLALSFFALRQLLQVMSAWWLSQWAGNSFNLGNLTWVAGYGLFGLLQAISEFAMSIFIANRGITAAKNIHDAMLCNLIHLPVAFFDKNPSGRILNRATKDQASMDDGLTWQLNVTIKLIFGVIGTVGAITYVSPLFLLVALPIFCAFYWIQIFYRSSVRELKRLESITRSPIYSVFGETLAGSSLIRTFGKESYTIHRLEKLLNHNQKFLLASMTANRWLNMRLELLGAIVMLSTSFFAVAWQKSLGAELVGFALNYAFSITASLSIVILVYSEAEKSFLAVERVLEYTHLTTEKQYGVLGLRNRIWPEHGKIEFRNVYASYDINLPDVLKNVNFTIKPGQRVGIVGRTGSGKSSLMLSLFRMINIRGGQILIDDVDIACLDLEKLRTSLAMIPQDPTIFRGSVRSNLDPFNTYTDSEIKLTLNKVSLGGLELGDTIADGGLNLSVGQRQLLCLARALLLKTKILILDEATAHIDPHTDKIIQSVLRREIGNRTVLVIAHRVHTIIDSDVILLFDSGKLIDIGPPLVLYENAAPSGGKNLFRELIDQYGDEAKRLVSIMRSE